MQLFHTRLVTKIRKTSLLPNIRDDAITDLLQLTKSSRAYSAAYTPQFNDFPRRSRQQLSLCSHDSISLWKVVLMMKVLTRMTTYFTVR
jgi:hypothetical protein